MGQVTLSNLGASKEREGEWEKEKRKGWEKRSKRRIETGGLMEGKIGNTLIEGSSIGLKRGLALGKNLGIHRDDPNKHLGSGRMAAFDALTL